MTTNILVNGCSFTFGHGEVQYPDTGDYMPPKPWVWPFQLEKLEDVKSIWDMDLIPFLSLIILISFLLPLIVRSPARPIAFNMFIPFS